MGAVQQIGVAGDQDVGAAVDGHFEEFVAASIAPGADGKGDLDEFTAIFVCLAK